MAGVQAFSEKVIDYATRLSDVADAAQGKRRQRTGVLRWAVLPASGAALLAVAKTDFFARQAKEVVSEAKTRASDLPDELLGVVRQAAGSNTRSRATQASGSARPSTPSARKRGGTRKTGSSRKRSSATR